MVYYAGYFFCSLKFQYEAECFPWHPLPSRVTLVKSFHLSQIHSLHLLKKIKILGGSYEVMSVKALGHGVCSSLCSSSMIVHYWRTQKIVKFSCRRYWKNRDNVVLLYKSLSQYPEYYQACASWLSGLEPMIPLEF